MTRSIDMLNITIGWEWALGIIVSLSGTLIFIAWKGSARFTALETSMEWVRSTLHDLKISTDNATAPAPAFGPGSPIDLKTIGLEWLGASGLKTYIDGNKDALLAKCHEKKETNPYEVQKHVFAMFDTLPLPPDVEDRLKKFAFEKGSTMGIMRRVGAIYLRNICLAEFGMNKDDIDMHEEAENNQH